MTDTLEPVKEKLPPEAFAKLERLRRYFKSRFAMWDGAFSDKDLFVFSLTRAHYPNELTVRDMQSVEADYENWTACGELPEHIMLWYQTSHDDLMHLPR